MSTAEESFHPQEDFMSSSSINPEEERLLSDLGSSDKNLETLGDMLMLGKSTIVPMSLRKDFDPYRYTFDYNYTHPPSATHYELDLKRRSSKKVLKRLVVGRQDNNPYGAGTSFYLYGANRVQVPPEDPLAGQFVQMLMILNYNAGKVACIGGTIKVPVTEFSDISFGFGQNGIVDDISVGEHSRFKGAQAILLGQSPRSTNTDRGIHVLDQYLSIVGAIQGKVINPYLSFKHTLEDTPITFDLSSKPMIAPPIISHD